MPIHSSSSTIACNPKFKQRKSVEASLEKNNMHLSALLEMDMLFHSAQNDPNFLSDIASLIRHTWKIEGVGIYREVENIQYQLLSSDIKAGNIYSFPAEVKIFRQSEIIDHDNREDNASKNRLSKELGCENYGFSIVGIQNKQRYEGFIVLLYEANRECPIEPFAKDHFKRLIEWRFEQYDYHKINVQQQNKIKELSQISLEKEMYLNEILQRAPSGIIQVKNRYIQFVNDRFVKTIGLSASELKNQSILELCADRFGNKKKVSKLFNDIEKYGTGKINLLFNRKNNSSIYCQITGIRASGDINSKDYLLLCQDKADVRNIEKSLMESEDRNRRIMEANIDGVFIIDRSGKLTYVNQSGCEMTGFSKLELMELNLETLFPYTEGIDDYLKIISSIQKEDAYHGDAQLLHKNGKTKYVEIHGTSISLTGKENFHFSIHDITHRKKAESKLRESEEKFRSLSENLPDCILRIEKEGTITYFNSTASEMFGSRNISLGLIYHHLNFPNKKKVMHIFKEVIKNMTIEHLEIDHKQTDGRFSTLDWSFSPEIDESGQCYSVLAIGRDVSIRKQTEKELILAKDKAEAADRVKSIFLANLSHEIRTPLNAIVGFSSLLDKPEFNPLQKKEFTELINKNADNLLWMINEIIDYAKLESGHIKAENRKINLLEILTKIRPTYETKTKIKFGDTVKFSTNIPVEENKAIFVHGDYRRIEQILTNLLENSLKFVTHGFIELGFSIEKEGVKIYVKDSGIGIAQENQTTIFEAFRQEEESSTKTYDGAGLGLAICNLLVEAMGGKLKVFSEKNKGAEFYFYLNRIL